MYTVNKFFEIIVRRVAGTANVLVIGSFLDGFERISLRVVRRVVIEPNVRDKAIAFDFEWAGIVFQPFDFEWEPRETMVPVVDEKFGHPTIDIGLFFPVRRDTVNRHSIDG